MPDSAVQQLIEIAVVPGVDPNEVRCSVVMRVRQHADLRRLGIECGLPEGRGALFRGAAGFGLAGVRARREQLLDGVASLELGIEPGRRALARIVLPFREVGARGVSANSPCLEVPA